MTRKAHAERKTHETSVTIEVDLDGKGDGKIQTDYPFFSHMLTLFSKHSYIDLEIQAKGDSIHHVIEDVAIVLGNVIDKGLGDRRGINRFGSITCPMDDALTTVALDLGGRPYTAFNGFFVNSEIEEIPSEIIPHFIESFANALKANIHVQIHYGVNDHHKAEAVFKGLAKALRQAIDLNPRETNVPSSKGILRG